ncbi:M1 family metallopeptidase [Algivirga pacifica]|uniref:M1 family metallopeptidase n=1 Tax=Algivirga pacifica TaxID=1162670 RepID=A0ABP9DJU6_9BACT
MRHLFLTLLTLCLSLTTFAQTADRWLQHVDYKMVIDFRDEDHQFDGTQTITYTNNSPDTLTQVFYHLYFNAFQPNSMMDVRSRTIADPDSRVKDRISKLKPNEIGYQKVLSLTQNGKKVDYHVEGTVLEVTLAKPILPGKKATFEMDFTAQVPIQIRRSGRNSKEGVAYSMAQWFPKLAEYDYEGWHSDPYVGREFHGVWGDFDVKISIDKDYVVASTGYLQNAKEVGHGYEGIEKGKPKDGKLTWHFKAPNVHDFTWAADKNYIHKIVQASNGPEMHFFWIKGQGYDKEWNQLPEYMDKVFDYLNTQIGAYPYKVYNFVQGGDGGMEYGMLTLITGQRKLESLVGVATHELIHSWFQFILATNESLHEWMDEGFNSYYGNEIDKDVLGMGEDTHGRSYRGYFYMANSGDEEPLSTHADHYNSNRAYGINAYSKGAVYLHQLSYVVGQEAFDRGMKRYYHTWKFKHPNPNDFIRIMEKESGLELDWYNQYFVYTTKQVDYGIKDVFSTGNKEYIVLNKVGKMPMPLDLQVTYTDGSKELFYIPLSIMRGEKAAENSQKRTVLNDWPWTHPTYTLEVTNGKQVEQVVIDPSGRMADIDQSNNTYQKPTGDKLAPTVGAGL